MTHSDILFRAFPYAAAVVCLGGLAIRAALASGRMPALRRATSEALATLLGGRLARICVIALGATHLFALLWPRAVLRIGAAPWRLVLLEVIGLALGIGTLALAARATGRLIARRRGSTLLDLADSAFLALVLVAVGSGVLTAVTHRWVSSWAAVTIAPWAWSLLSGQPEPALVAHLPVLARIHVVGSLAAIALFPLTRLGGLPIVATAWALELVKRPLAAANRGLSAFNQRLGLHARLWPEAEIRWLGPTPGEPVRGADAPRKGEPGSRRLPPSLPGGPRAIRVLGTR